MLEGSRIERGRNNRTNIRKKVVREPMMVAQTMRRRILLTGGSELFSTATAGFDGLAGAAALGAAGIVVPALGADN